MDGNVVRIERQKTGACGNHEHFFYVMVLATFFFCIPGLFFDLFFILWAREKLLREFRERIETR